MSNKTYSVLIPHDNTVDAFVPEVWSNESIMILIENMVMGNLVYIDFKNEIAQYGDVVNTRKPGTFEAKRKTDADTVTVQNATATNVAVKLDQHWHTSFMIKDGEETKSFKDLVAEYLEPAIVSIAQAIDKILLGQYAQFVMVNRVGALGGISSTNGKDYLLDARKVMNDNKAPISGRNMVLTSATEATILKDDSFTNASSVGDAGTALREASLGRKLGFDNFMCQNASSVANEKMDVVTGAINNGNLTAGSTTITVDGFSVSLPDGAFMTIEGEMVPHRISSATDTTGATTEIVLDTPLTCAIANDKKVYVYVLTAATNWAADTDTTYAAGYCKAVHIDGVGSGNEPQVGQMIAIGTGANSYYYTIISATNTAAQDWDLTLDRPLEAAVANDAVIFHGPVGEFNLGFCRNAIALVTRPLAAPKAGTGALASVVNYNGLSVRTVITYDGDKQGHLVTVDMLCGVKVLDTALGVVMLG